jgi:hypothetical protein
MNGRGKVEDVRWASKGEAREDWGVIVTFMGESEVSGDVRFNGYRTWDCRYCICQLGNERGSVTRGQWLDMVKLEVVRKMHDPFSRMRELRRNEAKGGKQRGPCLKAPCPCHKAPVFISRSAPGDLGAPPLKNSGQSLLFMGVPPKPPGSLREIRFQCYTR